MRNWLIKLLGGVTKTEHTVLVETEGALHSWQGNSIEDLRNRLDAERAEVKRLQELIFREHGVIQDPVERQASNTQVPISTRGMPWMRRKRELEKTDYQKAHPIEEHWRATHEVGEVTGSL